jgi:aldehyde:ferredoxin oxidoreductase
MKWILRINTKSGNIEKVEIRGEQEYWGGRLLIAKILLEEVSPNCDPLGRYNKVIFAPGLLSPSIVPTTGRFSIGGKSPLTGGCKECNVGGDAGKKISKLGLRAIILEDLPNDPDLKVLFISSKKCTLIPFNGLKGKTVSETIEELRKEFGNEVGIACIGPAGEMKMSAACVAVPDRNNSQLRVAARGGLGAVMGSKGIKAIVVDDSDSEYSFEPFDEKLLRETNRRFVQLLMSDPKTENRHRYGTPAIIMMANELGLLPTRNFSTGSFEGVDKISGEYISDLIEKRGGEGKTGTPCTAGCTIACSNVFPDSTGKKIVASLQYENIVLLGPNCGIGDIDEIAKLNHLCNEAGVDTIEVGAAIGVLMEAGVIPFGDAKRAKEIVEEIGKGTHLGRIVGNGAYVTGKVFGVRRVPVVKKQAIPGYDPRALKGNGVTYITSPMGADHTAGNVFEFARTVDPLGHEGQAEISRRLQIRAAILDTMGLCLFTRPPFAKEPELFAHFLKALYGWDVTYGDVQRMGIEVLESERRFNSLAGVVEDYYDIPEFMREEPLPPRNTVFDIQLDEVKRVWRVDVPSTIF